MAGPLEFVLTRFDCAMKTFDGSFWRASPLLREDFSVVDLLPRQTYQDKHMVEVECVAQVAVEAV